MRGNMRAERVRIGMTVDDVARAIGVHPNAVNRWEMGKTEPTASNLVKLSCFYGCTPEYLLGYTDDRTGRAIALI